MWSYVFAEFFGHHGFVIRPIANVHIRHGVTFEDDEVGADAVEEPANGYSEIADYATNQILSDCIQ